MSAEAYAAFMQEALQQAALGKWHTYPNPQVGAVLVRDNTVVATGWHKYAGAPHAEIDCLRNAQKKGIDPRECTLVVTLEPCRHEGKTPPCTDAILAAGIPRVVIGMLDPTKEAGGGRGILEAHGVEVLGPVCEDLCKDALADFLVWHTAERPYILLKMAATLDGRIATRSGHSQWITCEDSRKEVQCLREHVAAMHGILLIGGRTFRQDNPRLTVRVSKAPAAQPRACVLTSHLPRATEDFHLLQERPEETIFFSSAAAAASTQAQELRKKGVRVMAVPQYSDGTTDLRGLFRTVFTELHAPYVLCEGGGQLARSLLEEQLVDEFYLHLAPKLLADNDAIPLFSGRIPLTLQDAIQLRCTETWLCGEDIHILLRPNNANEVNEV